MSEEKKHINYNAGDIQRYLQGKMTRQEMYELEKASLDDGFLADAMEGYAYLPDENHSSAISELKESLAAKVSGSGKVVEMKGNWKQWYRIAAALFIILGSAAIVYKFVFKEKLNVENIAQQKAASTDSAVTTAAGADSNAPITQNKNAAPSAIEKEKATTVELKTDAVRETVAKADEIKEKEIITDDKTANAANVTNELSKAEPPQALVKETENKSLAKKTESPDVLTNRSASGVIAPQVKNTEPVYKTDKDQLINYRQNIFKGRVVDSKNEPLPFSKLSIKNDSFRIGTYADANGYFSFVAPDSILEVDAKSVGFNNNSVTLQKGLLAQNKIVLQENNQNLSEVVVTGYNAQRRKEIKQSRKDTAELTEPEDGWVNYDTYLTNNIEIPEKIKRKEIHGEVELSFDVNKKGEAQNIKVQKSLSEELDKEAIRAVKEGPKWKPKKRKAKGKLIIRF
jgi:TonB family protein